MLSLILVLIQNSSMSVNGPTLCSQQCQGSGAGPLTAAIESPELASPLLHAGSMDLFGAIISDLHQHRDRINLPELAWPLLNSSSYWSDCRGEGEQPVVAEHGAGLRPLNFRHCNESIKYILCQWHLVSPAPPTLPKPPNKWHLEDDSLCTWPCSAPPQLHPHKDPEADGTGLLLVAMFKPCTVFTE